MNKEGFIIGSILGAAVGILVYKNSTEAKKVIDKGEKLIKDKIEDYKKDLEKKVKKTTSKKTTTTS